MQSVLLGHVFEQIRNLWSVIISVINVCSLIIFDLSNDFPAFKIHIFWLAQGHTIEAVQVWTWVPLRCSLLLFFSFQAVFFIFMLIWLSPLVTSVAEWSKAPESDASAGGESPVRAPVRAATLSPYT